MNKKLSFVASTLLLTSGCLFANSTIDDAFKNGEFSGDVSVYLNSSNNDAQDSGYSVGSVGIYFETASVDGISAIFGARGHHKFSEEENGDYEGSFANDALINTIALKYTNDLIEVTAGRQEVDLSWLIDYNEAIIASYTPFDDLTVTAGYSTRQAVSALDESSDFEEVTKDNLYVVEANYTMENLEINPYIYRAPDWSTYYGVKASYSMDDLAVLGQYVIGQEDSVELEDGSIFNLEGSYSINDFSATLGYISIDKDGTGGVDTYGEGIDPTEELADQIFAGDSNTIYVGVGYEKEALSISGLYTNVDNSDEALDAKELTLGVGYSFTETLEMGLIYSDFEIGNDDADSTKLSVVYSF